MRDDILVEVRPESEIPGSSDSPAGSWWEQYERDGLRALTATARAFADVDCARIAKKCIPSPIQQAMWPDSRVRTGVIVGSVQSGKTASMFGLAARLLDDGLDILIILAGTRIALWKQTYERLLIQLDGTTPDTANARWSARVLVPQPLAILHSDSRPSPSAYMAAAGTKIETALLHRKPVIFVVPKQEQHLLAIGRELQARIKKLSSQIDRRLHMVVMDDEADDASVLDAIDSKTIPRRIEMLWSDKRRGETANERLYATYVAYTATPQANFLQQSHNPLAPRSFCAALRSPYKFGNGIGEDLSPTFTEPEGITRYYCGGEFFYNEVSDTTQAALCQATQYPSFEAAVDATQHSRAVRLAADRMLMDGLRAYLVSGAIRLLQSNAAGRVLPPIDASSITAAALDRLPPPHSMLVHPSARQDIQSEEARRLVCLSAGIDPDSSEALSQTLDSAFHLNTRNLSEDLCNNAAPWRVWLANYRSTLNALATSPGVDQLAVPLDERWPEIAGLIAEEILPRVRIRLINSDPASDDRPMFVAPALGDGTFGLVPDQMTIFISGNVMSRGLTIEGLCTTVFTRPADEPAADTQMQMQRWFGYRGKHAHLCRVMMFDDQLILFRTYHEHDISMRTEILSNTQRDDARSPNTILQGPRSLATAKVSSTRLPLHPGPTPSVRLLEADDPVCAAHNANLLASALASGSWVAIGPDSKPRGVLRQEPATLETVAEMLEALRFANYDPTDDVDPRFRRWKSLEDQLGLLPAERPLFRPPGSLRVTTTIDIRRCPYSIAAYLRLWAAALRRVRCDGLYPSDSQESTWAIEQPLLHAPNFYVGVAYGESGISRWPKLREANVHTMTRGEAPGGPPRMLNTLWGRRSEGGQYFGDQLFDYNFHKLPAPRLLGGAPIWRPRGHPGLLLFHVIRPPDGDLDGVTVGLALPHGGPEQFAALPALTSLG